MMCSNEKEGFFRMVSRKFGETYKKLLKNWISYKYKICLVKQQRRFLIRCRSRDLLPPHIYNLKFKVTLKDFRTNRKYLSLKEQFQKRLLNLEISDIHSKIDFLMFKLENIERSLSSKLPRDVLNNFYESNNNRIHKYNRKINNTLVNKFNTLKSYQENNQVNLFIDNSKWIVNNCSKVIPEHIMDFLSLGEKFALPINVNDSRDRTDTALGIVKNFEASSHRFPERVIDKVRAMVVNSLCKNLYCIKHLKYFDAYIHKEFIKCKKFFKNNDDILVTKADKGQVTVIMDRIDYVNKMVEILNDDSTYRIIKNNPLSKITTKLDNLVKMWRDKDIIDEWTYKKLKCTNGNLPRCYGLPKIHKPGHPLRIVVASVGSPLYEVAKFINNILSGSIKKPLSHIKDCWSFAEKINEKIIEPNEILVSLDVTSLFTNIPRELVIQAVENRWTDIQRNTKLSLNQLISAIDLVLSSTSFVFNGQHYEQIYGSPMGSPLSPILADMVMDDLEMSCVKKLDFTVNTFFRYVDDIFMIVPRTKLDVVMLTFNNYHPRLRFTYEIETNGTLNFLNTTVIREDDGSLVTNWFRKPTFSGRYINFYSNHPYQYKLNTIKNLVDHAILLSDIRFHFDNLKIVESILLNNGYPKNIVINETKKRYRFLKENRMNVASKKGDIGHDKDKGKYTMAVPYIGNVSDDIKRIVKNMVDVSYTIPRKLDTVIRKGKDIGLTING